MPVVFVVKKQRIRRDSFLLTHKSGAGERITRACFSECPVGWEEFDVFCYKFVREDLRSVTGAKDACARDGAHLLSVNSDPEHSFVLASLNIYETGQTK